MINIHHTSIVSGKAKLGDNITISPYAVIHDDVEIGDNCYIGPFAVIYNGARIGNNVRIFQSASIAHIPQDLKFKGEPTQFIVGDNTTIHEFVTLHRGTLETGKSQIGKNCLLMAYSHVAHDCHIGDNCILANGVQIAGHVTLEDFVIIGGLTPVHQFCHVGQHVMVGGGFRIVQDVPPFVLAGNEPLRFCGLNSIGLRRRGFANEDIEMLKKAYALIYNSGINFGQAKERIMNELEPHPLVNKVLEFINNSTRGIIRH